jgi:SAM-dependent methyltransferase
MRMAGKETDEAAAFRAFEHEGWQRAAAPYAQAFGRLTTQAAVPLLDAVAAGPGVRLLDVASGPGYVAAEALRRGARVTAVDFSAAMVTAVREAHPLIDASEADAEDLPFESASFDAVTCNYGLLHFGRPERALAEMRRVLRAGGRAGATVWAPPHQAVAFGLILDAVAAHGRADPGLPSGPPFFRFSDPAEFARALRAAGFVEPTVAHVHQVWHLPSVDALFAAMREGTVRTAGLLAAQRAEAQRAIRQALHAAARPYLQSDGSLALPMPAVLATGVAAE